MVEMMRHAYDRGINLFDLADLYGTHASFRTALCAMDRSKVAVLTKLWWRYDGPQDQSSAFDRGRLALTTLDRFRSELATDHLDIVLLHCVSGADWDDRLTPYLEVLTEEKSKQRICAIGCSCLDLAALRTAASSPWVDVILAQDGVDSWTHRRTLEADAVLSSARRNNKAIIRAVGDRGKSGATANASFCDVRNRGTSDATTIGFRSIAQIDDMLFDLARRPIVANV
jgi:aryl-alcohol dehydrogenase-like predicted oxidoreductase